MNASFSDVLARRGPGYDLDADHAWSTPRDSAGGRLLDAVTHSGPGYAPASPDEVGEHLAASRKARNRLAEFLHTSFGMTLAAKDLLDAIGSAEGFRAQEKRQAAEAELRMFVEYFHSEWPQVLACMRETVGPLDLRTRYLLARMNRVQRNSVAHVEQLVDELARDEPKPDHTTQQTTRVSIRQASVAAGEVRSIASLLHAAVR